MRMENDVGYLPDGPKYVPFRFKKFHNSVVVLRKRGISSALKALLKLAI